MQRGVTLEHGGQVYELRFGIAVLVDVEAHFCLPLATVFSDDGPIKTMTGLFNIWCLLLRPHGFAQEAAADLFDELGLDRCAALIGQAAALAFGQVDGDAETTAEPTGKKRRATA